MKLVVGLGNPGREYANNRHNLGFQCLDHLARKHHIGGWARLCQARVASGAVLDVPVVLAKPTTFVNLSGLAVGALVRRYRLPLGNLLVIYDDLDLPLGSLRLRPGGSAGGHKGMKSIIAALGTEGFPRLRVGIGRPPDGDQVGYVLSDFTSEELPTLGPLRERVAQAVECALTLGLIAAMNQFN